MKPLRDGVPQLRERDEALARPSVASLNSLAEVLRQAQPLYDECRSILNYLDPTAESEDCTPATECALAVESITVSSDAALIPIVNLNPNIGTGGEVANQRGLSHR
jgi:hypothetical protein